MKANSETGPPEIAVRLTCSPTYRLIRAVMRIVFRLAFRRRIRGLEHLPPTGAVVIVANHQSFLDIPLIAVATQRHVAFVARDSLARSRVLSFIMSSCGVVLVNTGRLDRAVLREMLAHLDGGDCLAIFPEGTRTRDGRVQAFRAGALLAARKARVSIVPVAIRGTYQAWSRNAKLPRPARVSVRFAPSIDATRPDALEHLEATIGELVGDGLFSPDA